MYYYRSWSHCAAAVHVFVYGFLMEMMCKWVSAKANRTKWFPDKHRLLSNLSLYFLLFTLWMSSVSSSYC